jgi:filamentous hemagglutinin
LDDAIEAYNQQFTAKIIRIWTQYNIQRTIRESQVVASDPGKILTGGHLVLRGQDLVNDKSRIVVGQTLQGDADRLVNQQAMGENVINDIGTTFFSNIVRKRKSLFGTKRWNRQNSGEESYAPADVVTTITLPVTQLQQNTAPAGTGTQLAAKATTGAVGTAVSGSTGATSDALSGQSAATSSQSAGQAATTAGGGATATVARASIGAQATTTAAAGQASNSAAASQGARATAGLAQQTTPGPVLPGSSLFKIDPGSNARYLVETDPRFTNFRQWLSSDYLLAASGYQPEATQKRLGDGFYEQKLIRDQVAALTGYRFLGDHRSDEAQYMALMTAGATFARTQQLRPGIALSAAQVAQLTSDMVWLETQTVTLPDGSTTTALAPRVYLAPKSGDLAANGQLLGGPNAAQGGLISAQEIQMTLTGDLANSGTIAGRKLIDLSAQNINNSGLMQGEVGLLKAKQDINISGGQVAASKKLDVKAGGDLNITSTTQSSSNAAGGNAFSQTGIDRVAGLYVSGPAGVLLASAGRDLNLTAAQVSNTGTGQTELKAGGSVNMGTVTESSSQSLNWNANNFLRQSSSQEVGSQVSGGGAVTISAQKDIDLRAANVNAQGALSIAATQGRVNIEAGQSTQSLDEGRQVKAKGVLSSTTTTTRSSSASTTAQGSELGGQTVAITSGADTRIRGSSVIGDQGVSLNAGGNVTIEAAQNTASNNDFNETKKSGLFSSGGLSLTIGKQSQSLDQKGQSTTAAASTVGSLTGNVTITAGQTYTQVGSDLLTPGLNSPSGSGDIDITAKKVDIVEARETGNQSTEQSFKQSGLTVAVTSPLISALQTASSQLQAAGNTSSGRMKALAAANAAMNLKQGADAVKAGQGNEGGNAADKAGGVGISASLGASSSQSNQQSSANTAKASNVNAGGNVTIKATGADTTRQEVSNLTVQGSSIQAGKTTTLSADNQVNLLAAANTSQESSSTQNASGSIGVGVQLGAGGGKVGVTASAAAGKVKWTPNLGQVFKWDTV